MLSYNEKEADFVLQRFFEYLDKILGITNIPYLFVTLIPLIIAVTAFMLVFWSLKNHRSDAYTVTKSKQKGTSTILLLIYFICMSYVLGELVESVFTSYFVGSIAFIVARVTATVALFFVGLICEQHYLVLFCLYIFVILGSLENNLAAQIFTGETVVDTINIYANGHWRISYHNPVYDALPYDSVLTVFLMHVLNISDPTSIFPKILIDLSSSLLLASTMIMFARKLGAERCRVPLALFTISMPYLTLEIPPVNLSIVFMALVMFLMFKMLKQQARWDRLLLILFFGCGILSHSQSVLALFPMLIISLFLKLKGIQHSKRSETVKSTFSYPTIVCVAIYLTYLAYTGALEATYGYIRHYLMLRLIGVLTSPSNLFAYVPNSVKLFYMPFLAPSLAWLGFYFLHEVVNLLRSKKFKFFRGVNPYNALILVLCVSEIITGAIAAYSLLGGEASIKHFAIFAYVCGAFAAFPAFIFAFDNARSRRLTNLLLLMLLFITVGGILTPHKMFDQYIWPPLNNRNDYRVSEWLVNHGLGLTGQDNFTIVVNGSWGAKSPSPTLYISAFKHTITNQTLARYPTFPYLTQIHVIHNFSELSLGSSSPSKIYNTLNYEVYMLD